MKIHADLDDIPDGLKHCMMLFPFWGSTVGHNGYDAFIEEAAKAWKLVDLAEADFALLPFDGCHLLRLHEPNERRRAFIARARAVVVRAAVKGRRTVVVVNSDSSEPVPLPPTAIVLRTSLNRRLRRANEFALPAWHEDIVRTHFGAEPPLRDFREVPKVSFCGMAAKGGPPLKRRIKRQLAKCLDTVGWHVPDNDGVYLRFEAMRQLSACHDLETAFVVRDRYFGGAVENAEVRKTVRREYIDSIVESDYVLCVRGYGNFSFRFFEALSLGRTPLVIDTECVFPYDFLHDYRDLCIVVPKRELSRIGEYVRAFHDRFHAESYLHHQRRLREFWETWLSPEGFFGNVSLHWSGTAGVGQGT